MAKFIPKWMKNVQMNEKEFTRVKIIEMDGNAHCILEPTLYSIINIVNTLHLQF